MTKNNQNGQTLVEYVLIIALITVIAVGLVKFLGGYLKDSMTKTHVMWLVKIMLKVQKQERLIVKEIQSYHKKIKSASFFFI